MEIKVTCAYSDKLIFSNIEKNSKACPNWLKTSEAHGGHAVIVGGGPSIADKLPLIKRRIEDGQTVFALNGAGQFLNKHGIVPDYQVFLDCLPTLTERIGEAKAYLINSQCDPAMLEAVPNPILWHVAYPQTEDYLPKERVEAGGYCLVGGAGATVGLTSLALAYGMGFRKLHLFGYDCSAKNGMGHGYHVPSEIPGVQEFIGGEAIGFTDIELNGKNFKSTLSMARQAELFPEVCNALLEHGCIVTVDVHEDSIMAEVLRMMKATQPMAA
jgi:hypothetical protein